MFSGIEKGRILAHTGPQGIRIIECFGLEETVRGDLAQHPCSEQGHLQLDEVAQSPVQPGLECFFLSGQPVPVENELNPVDLDVFIDKFG